MDFKSENSMFDILQGQQIFCASNCPERS